MKKTLSLLLPIPTIMVLIAFFLPWFTVQSPQITGLTRLLRGKPTVLKSISGFDIPQMANSQESRLIITIAQIFKPDIQTVDKKSLLLYAIPGLAALILLVSLIFRRYRMIHLFCGVAGILIFCTILFNLTALHQDKILIQVTVAQGLFLTMYGYLAIGVLELSAFFLLPGHRLPQQRLTVSRLWGNLDAHSQRNPLSRSKPRARHTEEVQDGCQGTAET